MKRWIWIALVSVCAACSSPSENGSDESADPGPNGTTTDSTVASDTKETADGTDTTTGTDATAPTESAESTETTDTTETAEATESTETMDDDDAAETTESADATETTAATEGTQTEETAEDPDMDDAVAAVDPADATDSTTTSESSEAAETVVAEDAIGLVAEKPAEGPFVETDQGFMVPYKTTIPGTDIEFEMVPVPGGKFTMGSPDSEEDRGDDEGPQIEIEIEPFWMGKYEVTWSEYKVYMDLVDTFIGFIGYRMRPVNDDNKVDAVSAPSNLYDPEKTFANGEDPRQPAVTMTPYAAKQYTKWLSRLTGQIYRLPTEAEWEYACRAGASTAYAFGDDPADLGDYAWYAENSDETTHLVGEKQPNAWGLYDMYGNASELVLDEYREDAYSEFEGKTVTAADAVAWPTDYDFRVHRGGAYDDFEDGCRSAARETTEGDDWKNEDPNEPKSPWWYADPPSLSVGMRIIRPLNNPSEEMLDKAWSPAVERILESAEHRINEGRGAWGLVDPELPAAVEELRRKKAGG